MTETEDLLEQEDTQSGKFLTFLLGDEFYGVDIKYVTEIISFQPLTSIPELPDYIRGIINLRGKIIPIMDVRLRFKKPLREYDDRTCVIVIDIQDTSIGLIVDRVAEVLSIPEQDMVEPPHINKDFQNKYVRMIGKVGNEVKLLLDCNKMLDVDEVQELNGRI